MLQLVAKVSGWLQKVLTFQLAKNAKNHDFWPKVA